MANTFNIQDTGPSVTASQISNATTTGRNLLTSTETDGLVTLTAGVVSTTTVSALSSAIAAGLGDGIIKVTTGTFVNMSATDTAEFIGGTTPLTDASLGGVAVVELGIVNGLIMSGSGT